MTTNFKPNIGGNLSGYPEVRYFTVDPAATFEVGELVYWDVNTQTLKVCGTNPALIAGVALASAAFGLGTQWPGNIFGGTAIPVALLKPSTNVFMASSATPAITNVGVAYDIQNNTHVWRVNLGSTGNTRVRVLDFFNTPFQEGVIVNFLEANLQFAS